MSGVLVTLGDDDVALGERWAGEMTRRTATKTGLKHWDYGAPTQRFKEDPKSERRSRLRAYCAELAVARLTGLPWHDPDHQRGSCPPDVGANIGVRWSARRMLILRPRDPDSSWHYLVTGDPPVLVIEGAILGSDGKSDRWWEASWSPPAWLVPAESLWPVDDRGVPHPRAKPAPRVVIPYRPRCADHVVAYRADGSSYCGTCHP